MVGGMSHRGLEGDDLGECSMLFIYILLTMALRGNVGKFTGTDGPRLPMDLQTP